MKKEKGFTLIELLVSIAIISLTFGVIFVIATSVIKNSKEEIREISKKNILAAGQVYTEEFNNEIKWMKKIENNVEKKVACVSIEKVIELGLLNENEVVNEYQENYVIQLSKNNLEIIEHKLVEKEECTKIDDEPPIITFDPKDIELEIKTDYHLMNGISMDGTGTEIKDVIMTLNGESIGNANELDLGTYSILYEVWDEGDNYSQTTRNITIIDSICPKLTLSYEGDLEEKEYVSNFTLIADMKDYGSGIQYYGLCQYDGNKLKNCSENSLESSKDEYKKNINVPLDLVYNGYFDLEINNPTWYFYTEDRAGNRQEEKINYKIDATAPEFVQIGDYVLIDSLHGYSAPKAIFKDSGTGVKEVRYLLTDSYSAAGPPPENDHSGFATLETMPAREIYFACEDYQEVYYWFAVAEDYAGNISEAVALSEFDSNYICPSYSEPDYPEDGPTCDHICEMQQNSEAWWQTQDTAERESLHEKNKEIAAEYGYVYEGGSWYESEDSEEPLYVIER